MGTIKQSREALATAERQGAQATAEVKQRVIDEVMAEHGDILAQDTFVGDPDTALIHHFREEVFEDETIAPYTDLLRRIQEHSGVAKVPVLIDAPLALDEYGNPISRSTTFINVDPRELELQSRVLHQADHRVHVHTNQVADITTRRLLIRAVGKEVQAGILSDEPPPRTEARGFSWWTLRTTCTRDDGRGARPPSDYAFTDSYVEPLDPAGEPRVFVGWDEIGFVLKEKILRTGDGTAEALRIQKFLSLLTDSSINGIKEKAPEFWEIISAVKMLKIQIGHAGLPQVPEDLPMGWLE